MRSKKAIYNIISNIVLQIITIINGFVVPRIIIGLFGSDVNGLISSITQFLGYITLLESGFGPVVKASLYKAIAKKNNNEIIGILRTSEKFFRRIAIIFIIYILILCCVIPLIVNTNFDAIFTISLIIVIAISIFAEYFFGMTYKLFLQADQKSYVISNIQTVTYIMSILAVAILAVLKQNILIIKLASGLIFVLRPIAQNYYIKKKYNLNLSTVKQKYELKQKWDGLAQHIAAVIRDNTDVTILTIFATLKDVSVYSIYYLVVSGIRRLLTSISSGLDASFGDMIAKKENQNLNTKFSAYELIYMSTITIIYSCAFILITPFVSIYTKGVHDANYIQPLFGYLIVLSGYIFAIEIPYSSLTLSSGHFKETKKGALVEAITNIIISILLVNHFGLVGVAIGTAVSSLIRMSELIYHANKYILKRNIWLTVKKILISAIIIMSIIVLANVVHFTEPDNFIIWIADSLMISILSIITMCLFYVIFCKKDAQDTIRQIKKAIKREK